MLSDFEVLKGYAEPSDQGEGEWERGQGDSQGQGQGQGRGDGQKEGIRGVRLSELFSMFDG